MRDWSKWKCNNIRVRRHTLASLLFYPWGIFLSFFFSFFFLISFFWSCVHHLEEAYAAYHVAYTSSSRWFPQGMSRWRTLLSKWRTQLERCICCLKDAYASLDSYLCRNLFWLFTFTPFHFLALFSPEIRDFSPFFHFSLKNVSCFMISGF